MRGRKCFLDDILVSGNDEEYNELVFQKLQDAGLGLKRSKCFIGVSFVEYLGYMIGADNIRPTGKKIDTTASASVPTNIT